MFTLRKHLIKTLDEETLTIDVLIFAYNLLSNVTAAACIILLMEHGVYIRIRIGRNIHISVGTFILINYSLVHSARNTLKHILLLSALDFYLYGSPLILIVVNMGGSQFPQTVHVTSGGYTTYIVPPYSIRRTCTCDIHTQKHIINTCIYIYIYERTSRRPHEDRVQHEIGGNL